MTTKTRKKPHSTLTSKSTKELLPLKAHDCEVTLDQVTLDSSFAQLLDPGDENDLLKLYEEIQRDGFRDPVVIVRLPDGTLILLDGYHRHRIWKRFFNSDPARAPKIEVIDLPDRQAAELWIIRNQLCRRNLTDAQKIEVAMRCEASVAAEAKENRRRGVCLNSDKGQKSVDTYAVLSKMAGVSRDTFCKAKKVFERGTPDLVQSMKKGDISINAAAQAAELPAEEQNAIAKSGRLPKKQPKKTETRRTAKAAQKAKVPAEEASSDQIDPCKLPYMVSHIGLNSRALLCELKQGHTSHFDSPAKVAELRSGFESLKQIMDIIDPQPPSSALELRPAPVPQLVPSLLGESSGPYKIVQFSPEHFDPWRDADNELGPEAPALAANAMFYEQGQRVLSIRNDLESLMQLVRDSAPNNLATIEGYYRQACRGIESHGTDLILMVKAWTLRQ